MSSQGLLLILLGLAGGIIAGGLLAVLLTARASAQRGTARHLEARLAALESGVHSSSSALRDQVCNLEAAVDRRLAEDHRRLDERLRESTAAVGSVRDSLARVDAANQRLHEVGREIAGLHDLLRAPKARGGLGELLLEELLSEMLPRRTFMLQHTFKSGARVDAVVALGNRLIPIDAKFPLESVKRARAATSEGERESALAGLRRDVKRHADAIAARYICPQEGTLDFALMYVPSERVYHDAVLDVSDNGNDLYAHCLRRRVIPVSPNTFYAYLSALLVGLRGVEMEERARDITAALGGLREEVARFEEEYRRVGTHLNNAAGAYGRSERRLEKWELALERLHGLEPPAQREEPAPPPPVEA